MVNIRQDVFTSGLVYQRIGMPPRKTVMICDDEADLLYLFRSALEPAYNVVAAKSEKDAQRNL
jgi:CheY-like chemotaxis protein